MQDRQIVLECGFHEPLVHNPSEPSYSYSILRLGSIWKNVEGFATRVSTRFDICAIQFATIAPSLPFCVAEHGGGADELPRWRRQRDSQCSGIMPQCRLGSRQSFSIAVDSSTTLRAVQYGVTGINARRPDHRSHNALQRRRQCNA
eukprot:6206880-Pleurochrysis_carterae.AAC.2